ncbi:hypothetical protein FOZ63_012484, partial [Perkinsus olseni]
NYRLMLNKKPMKGGGMDLHYAQCGAGREGSDTPFQWETVELKDGKNVRSPGSRKLRTKNCEDRVSAAHEQLHKTNPQHRAVTANLKTAEEDDLKRGSSMLFSAATAAALLVLFLNADAKSLTRGRGSRGSKISRPTGSVGPSDGPQSVRGDEIPMEGIKKTDRLPAVIAASVGNLTFVDGCDIAVLFQLWGEENVRRYQVAFKMDENKVTPLIATCEERHAEWIPEDKDFAELLEGFTTKAGSCLEIFDFLFNRAVAINKKLRNE